MTAERAGTFRSPPGKTAALSGVKPVSLAGRGGGAAPEPIAVGRLALLGRGKMIKVGCAMILSKHFGKAQSRGDMPRGTEAGDHQERHQRRGRSTLREILNNASANSCSTFSFGDVLLGHTSYLQAIQDAKEAKRPDLVFSAVAFCLWGEARSGLLTLETLDRASQKIESSIKRLPVENRDYAVRLWKTLSKQAREAVEAVSTTLTNPPSGVADVENLTSNLEFEFTRHLESDVG